MCNLSDWVEERGMKRGEMFVLIRQIQKKCRKNKS